MMQELVDDQESSPGATQTKKSLIKHNSRAVVYTVNKICKFIEMKLNTPDQLKEANSNILSFFIKGDLSFKNKSKVIMFEKI